MNRGPHRYGDRTEVPAAQTRAEIEDLVRKHGAGSFAIGWEGDHVAITFDLAGRRLRFNAQMPAESNRQAVKAEWRRLHLLIKGKLEAVRGGMSVEEVFLGETIIPRTGRTVAEILLPQLAEAYRVGGIPPLLEMPGEQLALPPERRTRIKEA